ncbi:MAG: ABC transporter ATP-binding protein [Rhodospirillales bacterium]
MRGDADPDPVPFSVSVQGAHLAFGGAALFDGLDLTLEGGRWTCLLGPSGVGKSALLRLILGLEAGRGARATVTCSDRRPLAGRAAYMAQRDLLLPWLTVLDNVVLGHRLRRSRDETGANARARHLLARVGLAANAADRPDALSGGMRQRAALSRTLLEDRPVVLMDEPFSAVDAITRVRLQELAADVLGGRTVLLVTHDPLEALRLGHCVRVMAGRPATVGDALRPPGPPPRRVDDPAVLELQGVLLRRLAEAAG